MAARCGSAGAYERRKPEETLLYQVVEEYWPRFLERAEEAGGLPAFVVEEFEAYLRCGLLKHGLVHLACRQCGEPMVVAFSCKKRGFCPSCLGRRMADVAAHLVDEVFPHVPVRQWVCSLPWQLRVAVGYDGALCADVLRAFVERVTWSLKARAVQQLGLASPKDVLTGAVTMVQRSDAALRLNVHFHTLALDGVYLREDGRLSFRELAPPTPAEVEEVARSTRSALAEVCQRHGRWLDGDPGGVEVGPSALELEHPVLAGLVSASAADVEVLGDRPGQRTGKVVQPPLRLVHPPPSKRRGLSGEEGGVSVHAGVSVGAHDRVGLEGLCRYIARPPLSQDRLEARPDGRLRLGFKRAWKDGTEAVLLHPLDLLARLCALVPPPRWHMLRYHGVLAAHASARPEVVPGRPPPSGEQVPLLMPEDGGPPLPKRPSRHRWAWLLARVFQVDLERCPACGGALRLLEVVQEDDDLARVLAGRPRRIRGPPPVPPGQLAFHFTVA